MQVDDQRLTRKDAVFDNVKILNGNQIPLTNTLADKLPLRGSLIALKSGNIHDLYYGDGLQWVPVTNGGSTADPPLVEVLAAGNATGGNDIEITDGDRIVSETDGDLVLRSLGGASDLVLESEGTTANALFINSSLGGILITSGSLGTDTFTSGQLLLRSSQDAADAIHILTEDLDGGIDIDAGTGGVAVDSIGGQIALTSTSANADAIRINASAGGVDVDSALQLNLTSTQIDPAAVRIQANGGGIDIDASTEINIATNLTTTLTNTRTIVSGSSANISTTQTVAPTVTASGGGGAETIVAGSTDTAGSVSWTPSTDGADIIIDFGVNKATSYVVMITPTNTAANLADLFVFAKANNTFTIRAATVGGNLVTCDYLVIGYE